MKPPPIAVLQIFSPVRVSTAQTVPVQSPKYARWPSTVGVPETPTNPSIDQSFASCPTVSRLMVRSRAFVRVFE